LTIGSQSFPSGCISPVIVLVFELYRIIDLILVSSFNFSVNGSGKSIVKLSTANFSTLNNAAFLSFTDYLLIIEY
jgi:hypothetical protein